MNHRELKESIKRYSFLIILCGTAMLAKAQNDLSVYYVDRLHSSITFSMEYIEIMEFHGRADDFYAVLEYDPDQIQDAQVEVVVAAESLNTGMVNRDRDLHSNNYMDVANYPAIFFKSEAFRKVEDRVEITGDLTIKRTTRKVSFLADITYNDYGQEKQYLVLSSDPIELNRTDFEVGTIFRTNADKVFLGECITVNLNGLFKPRNPAEDRLLNEYGNYSLSDSLTKKYVGQYFSEKGTAYAIELMGGELIYRLESAGVFRALRPVAENKFVVSEVGVLMEFEEDNHGKIKSLIYQTGGLDDPSQWRKLIKK